MSLESSAVVWFTWARHGGRLVHPRPLRSLGVALWATEFIRRRRVQSVSLLGSFGSSGVVGFSRVRAGGRLVYPGWWGSLGFALGSLGSSGVVGFTRVRSGGRGDHAGSLALGFI